MQTFPLEMNPERVMARVLAAPWVDRVSLGRAKTDLNHTPEGHGIQQHSAGDLFPLVIIKQGPVWRWIDPIKRVASGGWFTQATAIMSARMWLRNRDGQGPASQVRLAYPHRATNYDRLHGLE
ncbi:hypothetical protein Axy23_005 [Achromobacter phage vB_AxyP_19-32_Axy23]|uniref:Uncharacterized protein n=1 Tax=Achromobacter phage vB_AxyP_19-32_Axy23 TaxID=2591047 RepID=A0A514CW35_9CAUD|nr:hypothetical protein Axy23_005 [Achromobacter phage vB_AxyP_19-32_Axy23]